MELFKVSKKSICHSCKNIDIMCGQFSKICGTDNKEKLACVNSCAMFNKDIADNITRSNKITVSHRGDSRIEMMGGGFKEAINGTT